MLEKIAVPCNLISTSLASENDVLRDEGETYAHTLMAAGVKVMATRYLGTIHDFALLHPITQTPASRAAIAQVTDTPLTIFA